MPQELFLDTIFLLDQDLAPTKDTFNFDSSSWKPWLHKALYQSQCQTGFSNLCRKALSIPAALLTYIQGSGRRSKPVILLVWSDCVAAVRPLNRLLDGVEMTCNNHDTNQFSTSKSGRLTQLDRATSFASRRLAEYSRSSGGS